MNTTSSADVQQDIQEKHMVEIASLELNSEINQVFHYSLDSIHRIMYLQKTWSYQERPGLL